MRFRYAHQCSSGLVWYFNFLSGGTVPFLFLNFVFSYFLFHFLSPLSPSIPLFLPPPPSLPPPFLPPLPSSTLPVFLLPLFLLPLFLLPPFLMLVFCSNMPLYPHRGQPSLALSPCLLLLLLLLHLPLSVRSPPCSLLPAIVPSADSLCLHCRCSAILFCTIWENIRNLEIALGNLRIPQNACNLKIT